MNLIKKLFVLLVIITLAGAGCGGPSTAEKAATKSVNITIWRTFDNEDTLSGIMNAYQKIHPNVSFTYRKLRSTEYKDALLHAFAEGNGPDIFSIHNTWMREYRNLITPLPKTLSVPYQEIRGTVKKETVTVLRQEQTITQVQLEREFIDAVADDVVMSYRKSVDANYENRIFGLPLSVDTMVMYYNRDLLNAAGIALPPKTWQEFQANVKKLTVIGRNDDVVQSGAAIGSGQNVERAFDILSLLMMQNQTKMVDSNGAAAFARETKDDVIPGLLASSFYTDFANPSKSVYTWNDEQPNSFEAFVNGKTAFFFGYAYHLPTIKARAEKLHYDIAPMPQISGAPVVNFANYWVETVSKASRNQTWAWDFIRFATNSEQVPKYLVASNKPTARRALIAEQNKNDEKMAVFTNQLLTAQSWYRGMDALRAEQAFLDLIDDLLSGTKEPQEAINNAQIKVNQTL